VILNDAIYQAADYVAFNQGTAVGTLRLVPPNVPESELTFDPGEIVVLHTPLADITPVAGIISEQFSTPLSHVSLRARAWKIPNIGLHGATDKLKDLAGKPVFFEAKGGTYTVRAATDAEVAATKAHIQKHVALPVADLTVDTLGTLEEMRAKDVVAYGTKASNLGEIVAGKLSGFLVPPGFGVPFHYYQQHLTANGLDKTITAMLGTPEFAKDPEVRKQKLASSARRSSTHRSMASCAPRSRPRSRAPRRRRRRVRAQLDERRGSPRLQRRRSLRHDAEPARHRSGHDRDQAGLGERVELRGVRGPPARGDRSHQGLRRRVLPGRRAGDRGRRARDPAPDRSDDEKNYTINAKSGLGMSVVDGKKVPESLIVSCTTTGSGCSVDRPRTRCSCSTTRAACARSRTRTRASPVLTNTMAIELADAAKKLTRLFKNNRLDIEWVFAGDQLYIVQTRPLVQ